MTTAATSLLGLALPVTGELSGTWGDTVNNSITSLLDSAVAGTTTLSADADVTLTTTTLAANQAREAILLWTAAGTTTRTITAPAQSKTYVVINKSSTQSIKLVGAGPTTGVTLLAGESALVSWNGSDFVKTSSSLLTALTGILSVANGGTGLTSTPANGALDIGNGSGFTRATLTAGSGVTITNASGSITIAATGSGGTLGVGAGGTGQTTYTDGQLLIGNSTGNTLAKSTLTAGSGISVTNGSGSVTIAANAATATTLGALYGSMTASGGTPFLTAVGYNAGNVATGVNNTFFGKDTGKLVSTGTDNTIAGWTAGDALTTGNQNTAFGSNALGAASTTSNLTAFGYQA